MKVISGEFKGRTIEMPKGTDIRPTSDKAREALFNILKDKIEGKAVLDLFAGSGSLGIEALSRGAESTTFVDIQKRCTDTIKKNLRSLSIDTKRVRVLQYDALKSIKRLSDQKIRFDLIFMDPPYYGEWIKKCLISLSQYDILYNSHIIICESFKKDIVPDEVGQFKKIRRASYGDTVLSFYIKRQDERGLSRDI